METMQSFISLEKSFQWINTLLSSPPIYHPVCALSECSGAVVSWSPVCLASSKICPKYPNNTAPHVSACVISPCDHLLAEEEERLVTAGSSCASARGPRRSHLSFTAQSLTAEAQVHVIKALLIQGAGSPSLQPYSRGECCSDTA